MQGSLVSSERLRFDFSHNKPLTKSDLFKIEDKIVKKMVILQVIRTNKNYDT